MVSMIPICRRPILVSMQTRDRTPTTRATSQCVSSTRAPRPPSFSRYVCSQAHCSLRHRLSGSLSPCPIPIPARCDGRRTVFSVCRSTPGDRAREPRVPQNPPSVFRVQRAACSVQIEPVGSAGKRERRVERTGDWSSENMRRKRSERGREMEGRASVGVQLAEIFIFCIC
jgi:hypothetical protein